MNPDLPITSGKSVATGRIKTGPRVTVPSRLRWKANGLDLLLVDGKTFDKKTFTSLLDEFAQTLAGQQDSHLIVHLKTLGTSPRLRWPVELYSSLLRWAFTPDQGVAAAVAQRLWAYLFGSPLPAWYRLDEKTGVYNLNTRGWKVWYDSLPHK